MTDTVGAGRVTLNLETQLLRPATKMISRDHIPAIGLGLTQIAGYGTLMYAYSVLLPHMAKDLDLSLSAVFWVLSLAPASSHYANQ